jgi:multidrug efflux pump subunit AcrB
MMEVFPPIIVATLVVIVSFLPMFFITGMMGPYMRPMALNVPVAMLMSMLIAFTVTPWLSYHLLKGEYRRQAEPVEPTAGRTYRAYRAVLGPLLDHRWLAWLLVGAVVLLFGAASLLPVLGLVPVKMLPFDNKNELQVVVDMPRGTTLEQTDAVMRELSAYLRTVDEVKAVLTFAGTSSPMDFNAMVRHYYLRDGQYQGDMRIRLMDKADRRQQSHAILLRLRPELERIGRAYGANLKLVEMPPGPPVLATLVAEVYGTPQQPYEELMAAARHVRGLFETEPGVVDVDDTIEAAQARFDFVVDKEKASQNGVTTETIARTVEMALAGEAPGAGEAASAGGGVLHAPYELHPLRIELRLPEAKRSSLVALRQLSVRSAAGQPVRIAELGRFEPATADQTIYHKNLRPVVYVFGNTAGVSPPAAILKLKGRLARDPAPAGTWAFWRGEGEWKITVQVFRDLGLAFGGALVAIYVILAWQTGSYVLPLVQMVSIPLTVIGIMPGFWLLNAVWTAPVAGYANPIFFTATAMIGMIALAGLADRNAVLLLDFVHRRLAAGAGLRDALVESGAVRFRPIVLTAGAAMLGAWPITLDPVFSGLAWALIFGLVVSTAFTLVLVPAVYWLIYAHRPGHGLPSSSSHPAGPSPDLEDEPPKEVTK